MSASTVYRPQGDADRKVIVTEVGTRDGFQSEKTFIPTQTKAQVINGLIGAARVRAVMSTLPPGAKGTTMRTGRLGYSCAWSVPVAAAPSSARQTARRQTGSARISPPPAARR